MTYLDDGLLRNLHPPQLRDHLTEVMRLLSSLGLGVNLPKSRLQPAQRFQFLGAWFDLGSFLIRPSEERVLSLGECFQELLLLPQLTVRHLARLIGIMDSMADLVPMGRWRVRLLHWFRAVHWPARISYEDVLPGLPMEDHHLQWWMSPDNLLLGVPLQEPLPDHLVYTDASESGWGAQCDQFSVSGLWPLHLQSFTSMSSSWRRYTKRCQHFGRIFAAPQSRCIPTTPRR